MKRKITQWECQIDGRGYAFSHEKVKGKHVLTSNGVPIEIKGGFLSMILGFDETFMLDGKETRLVIEKNVPDVVADGVYTQSGKVYTQRPGWVLVFAILCLLIPIVSLGGAIPAVLGILGIAFCVSVSKSSMSVSARVIVCILITLAAWVLWFLLMVGISMLPL